MPDPQATLPVWLEVDETWLSIGSEKGPVAVVLGPKAERLDLCLSGPGFDWGGWFTVLAQRGVLDRQQCTVGRHIRGLDEDTLTHLDRVLLPILQRLARERLVTADPVILDLWQAVTQGRVRLDPEVRQLLWHLVTRWHDLVRSQHHPPARVRLHQPPRGLVDAGAEDRSRRSPLRGPSGPRHGLKRYRSPPLVRWTPMMACNQYQRD